MKCIGLLAFILLTPLLSYAQEIQTLPTAPIATVSRGNSFNPDMSMNALILYNRSDTGIDYLSTEPDGLQIQAVELQFTSDVDPYWRFLGILSVHPENEVVDTEVSGGTVTAVEPRRELEYAIEPEEIYAETIAVPAVTFRIGKQKVRFGKQNQIHTHALPFIDQNLNVSALLGDDGLNDVGLAASALVPLPWFFEITATAIKGDAEGLSYFNSRSNDDLVPVLRLDNLWDLSDSSTLQFGLSGATGDNSFDQTTNLFGADLMFKWRPVDGGKYKALILGSEVIQRNEKDASELNFESIGTSVWAQYQFGRRWWVQARMEWLKFEDVFAAPTSLNINKWTALVGFVPSEFSAIRTQYSERSLSTSSEPDRSVMVQFNFSIGAHPAHSY